MNLNRGHGTSFGVIPGFLLFLIFFLIFLPPFFVLDFLIHGANIFYIFFSLFPLSPLSPLYSWGHLARAQGAIDIYGQFNTSCSPADGELPGPVFEIRERAWGRWKRDWVMVLMEKRYW